MSTVEPRRRVAFTGAPPDLLTLLLLSFLLECDGFAFGLQSELFWWPHLAQGCWRRSDMDPEALLACASLQGCLSCPVFTRAEDKAHDRHWSAVCMYVCVCVCRSSAFGIPHLAVNNVKLRHLFCQGGRATPAC